MRHKVILLLLLLVSSLAGHSQKMVLDALWRDSNIVVNGDPSDWDQPFRYYDSKSKIQYCVANDSSNIYICLKTMDDKAQMKILRTGMDVTLSATGKKKDVSVVRFPLAGETKLEWIQDSNEPDQQHLERPDLKKMKTDYALSDKRMQLVGFKNIPGTAMPIENKYGVEIAIGWDKNDVLTYEIKVPFSTFYKDVISAHDTLSPVTITVKVNGFDVPQQISNGSVADPAASNTGLRNQGYNNNPAYSNPAYGNQPSGQQNPVIAPMKINDMSLPLQLQVRMKLAYK